MNLSLKLFILEEKVQRSICNFKVGTCVIGYESCYKYLWVWFDEHLLFNTCEQSLSESAGRALGQLISKFKGTKNMGYKTYTKLFNACITPILDYSL